MKLLFNKSINRRTERSRNADCQSAVPQAGSLRDCLEPADCQSATRQTASLRYAGFTMIEIALCLAIIGFALVAIIGVLPKGLDVQTENREETVIDQDAVVWMNALREGVVTNFAARGSDDLTNYVLAITNYWARYTQTATASGSTVTFNSSGTDGYTPTSSTVSPAYWLTNGTRIIGLLSTPKYTSVAPPFRAYRPWPCEDGVFQSNYVVAFVRAMSGSAVEKFPQNNPDLLQAAFGYKLIVEIAPVPQPSPCGLNNTNYWTYTTTLQTNATDVRLVFRWPLLQLPRQVYRVAANDRRQTFRVIAGGQVVSVLDGSQPIYFLQPSTYRQYREH